MTTFVHGMTTQRIVARPFQSEEDWWRVRSLLVDTYPITPVGFNWEIRRWEGWRFHTEDASIQPDWSERIHLWETDDGRLVGMVHPDGDRDADLQLHPDFRHLEREMIAWAVEHLGKPLPDGQGRELFMGAFEYDAPRRRLLAEFGFEKLDSGGVTRRLRLGGWPLPPVEMDAGYTLRTTRPGDDGDCQRMADLLNAGFGRTFHQPGEYRAFVTQAPSFRHDLNLVAEAPDGSFAAHVGVTFEETNRYGVFEPVVTHPDHRRHGLARSLMFEGLHRLKALGATYVFVDSGDAVPANALYESVGFTEAYKGYMWRRVIR